MTKYPSIITMETPNGPMAFCEQHSLKYAAICRILGGQPIVTVTGDEPEQACANCVNEAKNEIHNQ